MRRAAFGPFLRLGVSVGVCLATASCELEALLGPVDPNEVTITLVTSGGIVGIEEAIRVDGEEGEVRGLRCSGGFCDFAPGDLLLPASDAQVRMLADALDSAGVFEIGDRDFGTECCDQFHYDLTYERGDATVRIQGTGALLPEEVQAAIRLLSPLARRALPTIVGLGSTPDDWPDDGYSLGEVTVEGLALRADVSFGGGCADHRMDLVVWGGWMESFPVQVNALITHDNGDDPCDAVVSETRTFDLYPLAVAYAQSYGPPAPPTTVIVRLSDPSTGQLRSIEVRLD